ncbi:sulfite exporter TauE/SafE family protein [Aliiglaciecola sp. LCG003]|uniref:sulfite exporter TauE/SafE family protein n=1 Tax=Aliiglaciecola sp. LCG003 TaxID=3053655 RepID=UPI0025725931|nr:sulfite exporter TauE/SafE family protein [Aliiglaciecola sp. LCG003]WJG08445.1 sulfite exporter TauE/SafE family protein [Aliiglaciecola sp. LCG003]
MEFFTNDFLTPLTTCLLIVLAGMTSFFTAAFGAGGGLMLLVVLASIMPMSVVIPVHGLVQLGSNANRAAMTFRYIDRAMLIFFSIGGLGGALSSWFFVADFPHDLSKIAVGIFVLYLLWGVTPKIAETSTLWKIIAGYITTFLSMFVGASGPLVGSWMHVNGYDKMRFTATFSSCMTLQHTLKALVYVAAGFSFWQWLPLILLMISAGALGTWFGLRLLVKLPTAKFKLIFRLILSVLSAQLVWQGILAVVDDMPPSVSVNDDMWHKSAHVLSDNIAILTNS